MIQFDEHIFQMDWFNHQLEKVLWFWTYSLGVWRTPLTQMTLLPSHFWKLDALLPGKTNMATAKNGLFADVFPIENDDIPASYLSFTRE